MCSETGIKVLLFIENFLFWLIGAGLVGIGAYVLGAKDLPGILQFLSGATTLCYLAIGLGAFLFVLGLIGCCGAVYHNKCLLVCYVLVLILFFLAEIGIGVYIGLGFGVAELEKIWNTIDDNSKEAIQTKFGCCGFYDDSRTSTPNSCPTTNTGTGGDTIGCYKKLEDAFKELDIILICVGVAIALLEIMAILMSGFLSFKTKDSAGNQVTPMQTMGHSNQGY